MEIFDVAILGGGVVGTAILNLLTRLSVKAVLLEKDYDVANGTSKANSGIVHAGFDAKPGTKKAILNIRGAKMFSRLCEDLNVPYIRNGALVIGSDMEAVKSLYDRGVTNGVEGLDILDRERLIKMLPNISDNITCGLFASTSAIVSPYEFAIALAEESVLNGGMVKLNFVTNSFTKKEGYYEISDGKEIVFAKKIVLAVGGNHNEVAQIFGAKKYDIKYRRGEYYLLDKNSLDTSGYTVFPLPTKESKGVLISPTTSGNVIVGPTSILSMDASTKTTSAGLKDIQEKSQCMLNNVNLRKTIRVFSGVRTLVGDDFVIERDENNADIINVTGICSPGLSASPAIAEEVVKLLGIDTDAPQKEMLRRPSYIRSNELSTKELNDLIKENSAYGKIVCRCESITEGEILDAIRSPLRPQSIDAIKRRTRAGMGRCQGGFCFSKVMELIARENNKDIDDIDKENIGSNIIVGDIR